ncbi:LysR family transcriptional regulator [Curtobacterium sp. S6]|uniref:LysR family transcriptional regulator n=1 Tax=Curtobacterium sp. S6 TaxID=1479623 RepID=UPI0004AB9369|nr:LysR family transcriptional regulator [Curtobacterium sp. S6]
MSLSPDLHRLRIFLAVFDAGSVTEAAAELGYAPSTVSEQLRTLAREAGHALFQRHGNRIFPTSAAGILEPHARNLLVQFERANKDLSNYASKKSSEVTVEFVASVGSSVLSPAATALSRRRPDICLKFSLQSQADETALKMARGEIDLAFSFASEVPHGLVASRALHEPFVAVVPVDDPLAGRGHVTLAELRDRPWINHDAANGSCSRSVADQCRALGFTPPYELSTDTFETTQDLVAAGLGRAVLPQFALARPHDDVRCLRLEAVRPDLPPPGRRVVILRRPETSEAVMEFYELLLKTGEEFLADHAS